jgi:ribonuclease HI
MPWIEATLRGQRVLVRAKPDGAPAAEGGRVEIRYGETSDRAYHAAVRNLEIRAGTPLIADDDGPPRASSGLHPRISGIAATPPATGASGSDVVARPARAWIAYTDGACSGNPGPAGCGVVLISPEGKVYEGFDFIGESTNNVAELTAILRAVEWASPEPSAILVHTDSQYSIGVLTKGWKAKVNQELIAKTKALLAKRPQARIKYVPGHAGVPMNERADELAREAIERRKTKAVDVG